MFLERKYYKKNLQLALPIIIANLGQATVAIIDNIMVGRLGAIELAGASLASVIITNVLVFGMGIAMSLTPLTGALFATSDFKKAGKLFQNSLVLNSFVGVIISIAMVLCAPLLWHLGQPAEVVEISQSYFKIVAVSMFPYLIFLAFKQFMEGIGNTRVSMSITIISNILNIALNYILIYGKFGMPAMGVDGAAVATLISRIFMPIAFCVYLKSNNSLRRYFNFFSRRNMRLQSQKALLSLGLPISIQMTIEVIALSATAIFMGWISAESLAANQIVLSLCSAMFMVVSGVSGAVTILVSHEYGLGSFDSIKKYTIAGLQISTIIMIFAATVFSLFGKYLAMVYTTDATVISVATKVFLVVALFEISDGYQVTILGALRGVKDVRYPMIIAFIAYILINIPVAYLLGFTFNLGESGIWLGFFIGLTTASIFFTLRFSKLVGQNKKRGGVSNSLNF